MTKPVTMSWSLAKATPNSCTGRLSNTGWTDRACEVKRSTTIACSTSSSPTEATVLASGGAARNGRKTSRWIRIPSADATTRLITNADAKVWGAPSEILVGRSGRSTPDAPSACATPSTTASGFGSGGRNRSPLRRSSLKT